MWLWCFVVSVFNWISIGVVCGVVLLFVLFGLLLFGGVWILCDYFGFGYEVVVLCLLVVVVFFMCLVCLQCNVRNVLFFVFGQGCLCVCSLLVLLDLLEVVDLCLEDGVWFFVIVFELYGKVLLVLFMCLFDLFVVCVVSECWDGLWVCLLFFGWCFNGCNLLLLEVVEVIDFYLDIVCVQVWFC